MDGQCHKSCLYAALNGLEIYLKDFIGNSNEDSDEIYVLEVNVKRPGKLHNVHKDLGILPETIKLKKFKIL